MSGMVIEPAPYRVKPSPEYIQQLREIGASDELIRLALGEPKPRRRWLWRKR